MTRGKSLIPAFTSSSPRQPMEPVGQDRSACSARRRSALATGWALTKDVSAASPKTEGAICRQASQSMQVESTKKSPGTFCGIRFLKFAILEVASAFSLGASACSSETSVIHHSDLVVSHAAVELGQKGGSFG